jgi:DNA-binding response OmpR family regulator
MKVLLIDDDPNIIELLTDIFKYNGYTNVEFANDGAEGLIYCSKNKYDLIYIDYHMPYLTGLEVLREIKQCSLNKETQIIMMSSDLPFVINEEDATLNKTLFLPKPINLNRFQRYINFFK